MKIRSFRLKILLALLGSVALLTTLTLVLVTLLVRREIISKSQADVAKAQAIFQAQQAQRSEKLEAICLRLTSSRRLAAALEEGDTGLVAGVAGNEREISRLEDTFLAITDQDGKILVHASVGVLKVDAGVRDEAVETFVFGAPANGRRRGHFVREGRIFEGVCMPIQTASRRLGSMVIAFPVTDRTAEELATVLGWRPEDAPAPEVEVGFLAEGRLVASTVPVSARRRIETLLQGHRYGDPIQFTWQDTPYVAFLSYLGGSASQVVQLSQRPLQALLAQLRDSAMLCGGGTILFCVWISSMLSRGISAPISELAIGARKIRGGNFDVRVQPRTADEIGRLAEAFNEMAEGLQLKEKYRGVLDKVVSPEVAEELLSGKIDLGGELRSATVLFCDIRGFTKMTEGMKPHDVLDLLNRHMTAMTEIVRSHGGIVDKFVGDELMAVFGAPKPTGNDARAALAAAVEMRTAREHLKASDPPQRRFEIGFGVNTGEVVAGNMGSDKQLSYTVLGKTVNLASRLCKAALPGKILASASTVEMAGGEVHADELKSMDVKGFSEPVRVFEVRGAA